jgi:hypothetical protein
MRTPTTSEPPLADTSGGAQDRQSHCNLAHGGCIDIVNSAFVNNLKTIECRGRPVSFVYSVLKAQRGGIPFFFDLPDGSEACVKIAGYKEIVEITATLAPPHSGRLFPAVVKTLLVSHTSVHERYLKECASMFQVALDIYKLLTACRPNAITSSNMFDFTALKMGLAPYVRFILYVRGDSKDVRLNESWINTQMLMGAELSNVMYDFWYGTIEKPLVTGLMQDMAQQLVRRV